MTQQALCWEIINNSSVELSAPLAFVTKRLFFSKSSFICKPWYNFYTIQLSFSVNVVSCEKYGGWMEWFIRCIFITQ